MTIMRMVGGGLLLAALAAAAGGLVAQAQPGASTPIVGYLPRGVAPSSVSLVPPAPAAGSATQARDAAASKRALTLMDGPRWALATEDARLAFPAAAETFSCALDVKIGPETTPRLYTLLRRTLMDVGYSTYPAKIKYMRARPFMVNGRAICTPADEKGLRADGSYPSGHAAVGWAWALILSEASPERQDAILARGRAFMHSRVVCNVHWQSDTEAGATEGAAVVARLHADPAFRADLDAARGEILAARAAGQHPTRDCAAEAAALAIDPAEQP